MRLFDASSIIEVLIIEKTNSVDILKDGFRLELTFYEVGNSIRRVYLRRKHAEQADATRKMRAATKVLNFMEVAPIATDEANEILQIAMKRSLTFYDASYLYAARRDGLTLVTEDDTLREATLKMGCATKRFAELAAD